MKSVNTDIIINGLLYLFVIGLFIFAIIYINKNYIKIYENFETPPNTTTPPKKETPADYKNCDKIAYNDKTVIAQCCKDDDYDVAKRTCLRNTKDFSYFTNSAKDVDKGNFKEEDENKTKLKFIDNITFSNNDIAILERCNVNTVNNIDIADKSRCMTTNFKGIDNYSCVSLM